MQHGHSELSNFYEGPPITDPSCLISPILPHPHSLRPQEPSEAVTPWVPGVPTIHTLHRDMSQKLPCFCGLFSSEIPSSECPMHGCFPLKSALSAKAYETIGKFLIAPAGDVQSIKQEDTVTQSSGSPKIVQSTPSLKRPFPEKVENPRSNGPSRQELKATATTGVQPSSDMVNINASSVPPSTVSFNHMGNPTSSNPQSHRKELDYWVVPYIFESEQQFALTRSQMRKEMNAETEKYLRRWGPAMMVSWIRDPAFLRELLLEPSSRRSSSGA